MGHTWTGSSEAAGVAPWIGAAGVTSIHVHNPEIGDWPPPPKPMEKRCR